MKMLVPHHLLPQGDDWNSCVSVSASSAVVLSVCPTPAVADILTGRTGRIISCVHHRCIQYICVGWKFDSV